MGRLFVIIATLAMALTCHAQEEAELVNDTLRTDEISIMIDTTKQVKVPRDWSTWKPNPQRALWLALVLPGAGQIYNRKYWKLPIFYGGFMGCIYALTWNNMMYKDYSQAYLDIMDNDPNTASYNKFLHLGVKITDANKKRYEELFKGRKDKYRRWRDMSIFVMIGVYALSVIDAYVDKKTYAGILDKYSDIRSEIMEKSYEEILRILTLLGREDLKQVVRKGAPVSAR